MATTATRASSDDGGDRQGWPWLNQPPPHRAPAAAPRLRQRGERLPWRLGAASRRRRPPQRRRTLRRSSSLPTTTPRARRLFSVTTRDSSSSDFLSLTSSISWS
ncbi:hypothetical protein M6B38_374715 [Iris pallida]|uniref:Uncharacterized protein n=1 Tax=Iris pallida TaxID=29817 RepID=A0AAX6FHQ2_IRIPA|nr:hypothetical protein M6B38_417870 [Iris pallida]KAJ6825897.1 hypothetical protein M6B38_374715 [Iris pallida]